jgi:hypothetical protein
MGWNTMLFSSSATLTNLRWGGDRNGGKEFKQGWNAYWNPELTKEDILDITCDLCVEEGIISEEDYWSFRSELGGMAWDAYSIGTDVADLLGMIPEMASKPLSCAGFAVGIVLDAIEETEESWKNIEEDATINAHDIWRETPGGGGYKLQQLSDYYLAYCVNDKEITVHQEERFWQIYSRVEAGELEPEVLYPLGASGLANLSASLPATRPLPKKYGWFGGDWDPEWEETWYWEGWDYPATDVAYERYGYVDESGAYDWDYDQSEIEEAWEWAPYIWESYE